jgi:hypothetical protein
MTTWICDGCGVEHADSDVRPPENSCVFASEVVAIEERGDLPPHGTWTTLAELAAQPHQTEHVDHRRGVHSLRREPRFAIGHRSFVVQTGRGNLLWDAPAYLDDDIVALVHGLGGVAAIAASHPHMFGAQLSWSTQFGDVPVYVNALDQEWLPRTDPVIELWKEHIRWTSGEFDHLTRPTWPRPPPGHRRAQDGRRVPRCGRTGTGTRCPQSRRRAAAPARTPRAVQARRHR